MKAKIILILMVSSLIIGCVEKPIEKSGVFSKTIIPESFQDITNKLLKECGKTLTTAQCDDYSMNFGLSLYDVDIELDNIVGRLN